MCGICFMCSFSPMIKKNRYTAQAQDGCAIQKRGEHVSDLDDGDVSSSRYSYFLDDCFAGPKAKDFFLEDQLQLLFNRGPDASQCHNVALAHNLQGQMCGCVLQLRGQLTPQPITDENGDALLLNGEIFGGIQVPALENDTQVLFECLTKCKSDEDVLRTLESIHGPWAVVFWKADTRTLWFGRDVFGRRSLLWHLPANAQDKFILTSVALGDEIYAEIPSVGIFSLRFTSSFEDLETGCTDCFAQLTLYPWKGCVWPGTRKMVAETPADATMEFLYPIQPCYLSVTIDTGSYLNLWIPDINLNLPPPHMPDVESGDLGKLNDLEAMLTHILHNDKDLNNLADGLITVLQDAVKTRVDNIPRRVDISCSSDSVSDCVMGLDITSTSHHHKETTHPAHNQVPSQARVAILFSGGLDSSVLAALVDRCLPLEEPVDLLNIAFEQPRTTPLQKPSRQKKKTKPGSLSQKTAHSSPSGLHQDLATCFNAQSDLVQSSSSVDHSHPLCASSMDTITSPISGATMATNTPHSCMDTSDKFDPFDVPDRLTGRIALSELNPNRCWNFVEINVGQEELQSLRKSRIRQLIYPLHTVLDDSIGCAIWFAARGTGWLKGDPSQPFHSQARVILCGMAADEQFAGYARHRHTFSKLGWKGLVSELQEEMWRISARNLGRDDRIIADHGKESRFPFLDENFTQFVSGIPVYKKANLALPRGVGEKLLLRVAALKLGLIQTACQPKRAIQFGSKIAKLDKRREKGSDICERLT